MLKNITKFSCLAASISMLIACGGSSDSDDQAYVPPPSALTTGRVIDGPLAGATVKFGSCSDSVTTTATGYYTAPTACANGDITVTGGVDITTDLPFTGILKAPKGAKVVTPITTLIATLGADKADDIAALLGLPTGTNLLTTDPTQNQQLYAKTVAVQQLVEEIGQAISVLGGDISAEELNAAAFAAVAQALASATGENPLQNTSLISQAIGLTLEGVKAGLPTDIQNNLGNVKANLSALTASTIGNHIAKIETAITSMTTFNPAQDNSAAIKAATKATITSVKEAVDTEKTITLLNGVLTANSEEVADILQAINTELNKDTVDTTALTASLNQLAAATEGAFVIDASLVDQLSKPNSFFTDYLKVSGFGVGNTAYTADQLAASATSPIALPSLENLFVNVNVAGSYASTTQSVGASLTVASKNPETVTLKISTINLTFNDNGALTNAAIPAGTTLNLTSQTRNATFKSTSALNVYENGGIALNLATLQQLLPNHLDTQIAGLAPKGTTTVTATISAGTTPVAYDGTNGVTLAPKFGSSSGVVAKFAIPE